MSPAPRTLDADVLVIGAGTAGLTATATARRAGARALMADPGPLGTTCARVGCMPSKMLIAAAEAAFHAREAAALGVEAQVRVDGPRVMARLRELRDQLAGGMVRTTEWMGGGDTLLHGAARFVEGHRVRVGDTTEVNARAVVIATGSEPFVPPPYRSLGAARLSTDQLFELEDLPESLLVIGAGAVGLELGQAMHRLGVRVTLLSVGGFVGPLTDPKVKAAAATVFSGELDVHFEHELGGVERDGDGVRVRFADSAGHQRNERFRYVLMAAGRRPRVFDLDLEQAGVEVGPLGISGVDPATGRIGSSHIFVAGDAGPGPQLFHEAVHEGRVAGRNAATWPEITAEPRAPGLGVVFSDPQLALVGQRFADLALAPEAFVTADVDFEHQKRAVIMGVSRGRGRLYAARAVGRLLGAELAGPRVEHMAHLLNWAIAEGLTVERALEMSFYHPTIEEALQDAFKDLRRALRRPAR